ncbi:MAG TPA: hypothetical protein VLM90_13910, partial [Candidatus Deferrimicrobium sp.]|nr:hypothetical protein [Candidatus Deferrimicrobium sp.]
GNGLILAWMLGKGKISRSARNDRIAAPSSRMKLGDLAKPKPLGVNCYSLEIFGWALYSQIASLAATNGHPVKRKISRSIKEIDGHIVALDGRRGSPRGARRLC